MNYLLVIFEMLFSATFVLAAGIFLFRSPGQTLRSAFVDSVAWSSGFFFCYSTAIMMFDNLLGG